MPRLRIRGYSPLLHGCTANARSFRIRTHVPYACVMPMHLSSNAYNLIYHYVILKHMQSRYYYLQPAYMRFSKLQFSQGRTERREPARGRGLRRCGTSLPRFVPYGPYGRFQYRFANCVPLNLSDVVMLVDAADWQPYTMDFHHPPSGPSLPLTRSLNPPACTCYPPR